MSRNKGCRKFDLLICHLRPRTPRFAPRDTRERAPPPIGASFRKRSISACSLAAS